MFWMCGEAVWIVTLEGLLGVKDSYSNLWLINSKFFRGLSWGIACLTLVSVTWN